MAGRHTRLTRNRGQTPQNSELVQREGRRMLGYVMKLAAGGKSNPKLTRRLPDGTLIVASYDGTTPTVQIFEPEVLTTQPRAPDKADMWIPLGFVVYPADSGSPNGWGLPVVPIDDPDVTPYDPRNRAPGLDVTRWTSNGALGQVLITKEAGGGYAEHDADLVIPLLYAPGVALRPLPGFTLAQPGDTYAAYRLEFADFTAQSPSAGAAEQANIVAQKRYVYEHVNTKRADVGRDPLALPIRGLYDGAQTAAEIMHAADVLGHFSDRFPWPYQTAEDRLAKEGFRSYGIVGEANSRNHNHGENAIATALSATQIGVDPDGTGIFEIVPGPDITGDAAFTGWLASPPHLAMMIAPEFDKAFATTTVGFKGAFATQHFNHHTQWVECGNRFWRSANAEIPTVSWFGAPQLNLAWETWPVAIDNSSPTVPPSADPLIVLSQLTDTAGDHLFWLRVHHGQETVAANGNSVDFRNLTRPMFDSRIFMRGRCIAIVPNDGWVWAASIIKYDSPDSDLDNVYRLVAIAHQESDQPPDQKVNGMTRYMRLWWCDLPPDVFMQANPRSTIKGIFGEEDEGWPWDHVDSPYSWQGGDLIDVGNIDALKYASQWVFNAAGDRAVCLRDNGVYTDYASLYVSEFQNAMAQSNGLPPRALELVLTGNAFNPLVPTLNRFDAPLGETPQDIDVGDPSGHWKIVTTPIAAGYGATDQLRFFFVTALIDPFNPNPSVPNPYRSSFEFSDDYDFAPADTTGIMFSTGIARPMDDEILPYVYMPSCLDVRDEVVTCFGIVQREMVDPDTFISIPNPDFDQCWTVTANPNIRVMTWRGGVRIGDESYANPDPVVYSLFAFCYQVQAFPPAILWIGTQLPLSQAQMLVPSYARSGDDWMFSYVVQPQPSTLFRITHTSDDCDIFSDVDESCSPTPSSTLTTLLEGDAVCRGGNTAGSLGAASVVLALTQTTGAGARFLYARSV